MSMNYSPNYGYGIHVPDEALIKPEYLDSIDFDDFVNNINGVLLDDFVYDHILDVLVWSVDKQHKLTALDFSKSHTGCILLFQIEPLIFGNTGRTYEDVIASLREEYGQYLVDDFNFENNFVKFEVVECC